MFITFTLPSGYSSTDAGPFNISGLTDTSTVVLLASGITKSQLLSGHTVDTSPYTIVSGTVASVGACTNEVTFELTAPTPTPTITPTVTTSQTVTPTRTPTLTPTYSQTVTPTIESVITPTPTLTITPDSVPDEMAMLYFEGRVCDTIITNWTTKTLEEVKCDWEYIITHPNWNFNGSGVYYYSSSGFVPGTQIYGAGPTYFPSTVTGNYVYTPNGENTYPIYVVEIVGGVITSVNDFATLPVCGTYECPTPTPTITPTTSQTVTPTISQTVTPTYSQTITPTITPTTSQTVTPTVTITRTPASTGYSTYLTTNSSAQGSFTGSQTLACSALDCIKTSTCFATGNITVYFNSLNPQVGDFAYTSSSLTTVSVSVSGYYIHIGIGGAPTARLFYMVSGEIISIDVCPTPTPTLTVTPTYSQTVTPTLTRTLTPTITPTLTPEPIGTVGYLADEFSCEYDPDTGESIQCNLVASSVEVQFPTSHTPSFNRYYAPNPGGCSGSVYFITGNSSNNTGPIIAGTTPYINCSGPISACLEECPL